MIRWIRSTRCNNANCVEVAWVKSTFSSDSFNCLEVAHEDHRVLLRDSKYEQRGEVSPIIEFTPSGWRSFLIVAQEWDRETAVPISGVVLQPAANGPQDYDVCILDDKLVHLHFTWEEWDAFVKGAADGEFLPEAS